MIWIFLHPTTHVVSRSTHHFQHAFLALSSSACDDSDHNREIAKFWCTKSPGDFFQLPVILWQDCVLEFVCCARFVCTDTWKNGENCVGGDDATAVYSWCRPLGSTTWLWCWTLTSWSEQTSCRWWEIGSLCGAPTWDIFLWGVLACTHDTLFWNIESLCIMCACWGTCVHVHSCLCRYVFVKYFFI